MLGGAILGSVADGPAWVMKNFLIAGAVCIAVTYAVDALWFNGQYYSALLQLISTAFRHFR